jgi:protease-4
MLKKLLHYLLFSILSFLLFLVLIVIVAAITMGPNVKENTVLTLEIVGPIMEEGPQGWKEKFLLGDVLTVRDIITSLKKAKTDDRVKALLVSALYAEAGPGKAQEVRSAIKDFAKSKKPVYGFVEDCDMLEYYMCSAATKLYMPPAGEGGVSLMGIRAEVPFFKGTLDKLGIVAQMDHIGAYKSASDIFTRDNMSEAHRESTVSLLNSLYDRITDDIARDRHLSAQSVKAAIDQGPLIRHEVKNAGLVDGLLYKDELENVIKKDLKVKKINAVSVLEYKEPTFRESIGGAKNKIGIVYATGTIMPGESHKGFDEDSMGSTTISKALRQARENDSVKAVVLRVDSPGGSAIASDLIWREVLITKQKKPVVVSMSDVAASGGYYVSMAASKILADPSTITGSIGVVYGKFYMKGLYDKIGLKKEVITRGKHADFYSDYIPFNDEEWSIVRKHMQAIYYEFTNKAAAGRRKTQAQINQVGQGRVWTGDQALSIGLVDRLGGLQDAIDEAKKLAKLSDKEEVGYAIYPIRKGFFSGIITARGTGIKLPEELDSMLTYAKLAEKENLLLLMPYRIVTNSHP